MLIRRMTASFGKLQGQSLELKEGLNILQAPNETGKSTWCAFLLSMFYGINSRERERAGFIPDKIRYAPWSGSSMSGRLDCAADGKEITLLRSTRRQTSPMGEFQAVYAGTSEPVPGLTGAACGEELLGVSREVFERSAFIRQSGLAITQDAELERRIAALITSGEETTSYSEVSEVLKKQLNRRRHNKTGQLPTLEAELQEILRQLTELKQTEQLLKNANAQSETLAAQETALAEELAHLDCWEAAQSHRTLAEAEIAAIQAEQAAAALRQRLEEERIPENETIGRLRGALVNLETTRKDLAQKRNERDEAAKALLRAEAAVNKSPFAGQTAENAWNSALTVSDTKPWPLSELLPSIFIGLVALYLVIAGLTNGEAADSIFYGIPCVIAALFLPFWKNRKWKKETAAFLNKHGVSSAAELREQATAYGELLSRRDAAQAELDKRSAAADTLYNTLSSNEQGILLEVRRFAPAAFESAAADSLLRECAQRRKQLAEAETAARTARMRFDLLAQQAPTSPVGETEELQPPARSRDVVTAELARVRADLAAARSAADRLSGQLHATGDPVVLASSAEHLRQQIQTLEQEYSAIRMAMDALDTANTALQNRFSPALGRRAAEIFSQLTRQRYSGVVLDRAFHISTEPTGDTVYRDSALLSAGTADQLYLATRLAICDLVLPEDRSVPIILDDALTNFDDARCAAALQWLKEAAHTRQILLFTCHSREADFFSGDPEVSVQRLTDAG